MPIIEYVKTTKKIKSAHFGMTWNASDWTSYESDNPGQAVIQVADSETTTHRKYLQVNDGVGTLHDTSLMTISVSVSANERDLYPLLSDNSAYIDFTSVPEGATCLVDGTNAGTMDASGIFRFKAQHAGTYGVSFELTAYETEYFGVEASDNI